MFNSEKLAAVIAAYKEYFPEHWKDEMYKWEAIQHFQKHWDINAESFLDMFMSATEKTYNPGTESDASGGIKGYMLSGSGEGYHDN